MSLGESPFLFCHLRTWWCTPLPFLPRRSKQKRYVDGVDPEVYDSLSASNAEKLNTQLSHIYSVLSAFKELVWITWSKPLLSGGSWQEGFLISPWQPLSSRFSAFTKLLKKAKPAQISVGLICKKRGLLIESVMGHQTFIWKVDSSLVFSFLLIFQNAFTSIPPPGLLGLVTC